jgi:putative NIF3 family GTP cyclohydrolase 1 type 2
MSASATVGDVDRALAAAFPHEWAEDWDRVGLAAGDPDRRLTGVLVTLDPTRAAIARAVDLGANLLVSHHPVALSVPERLAPGSGAGGALFAALDARVALIAQHTNLDRAPAGAGALPQLLGLTAVEPIERSTQPMTRVTVYAPRDAAGAIVDAMASVGAGRIGSYERSAFTSQGAGHFTPRADANPHVGARGVPEVVEEVRIEMVCARCAAGRVTSAARVAHPYEEPLIVTEDVSIARSAARMGMRCTSEPQLTLEALANRLKASLGVTPRVWGSDPAASVDSVVTATGSAGSLIDDVLAAGADTLVCGEVRYHDALDAVASGLAIVEIGHDVSEWPLVPVLAQTVRETPGLDPETVFVDAPQAAWWTPDGR